MLDEHIVLVSDLLQTSYGRVIKAFFSYYFAHDEVNTDNDVVVGGPVRALATGADLERPLPVAADG